MVIRRAILWWMLLCGTALAQSNPGFVKGQVPTAAQWNSYFTSKTDTTNGTLVNPSISGTSQLTGTVSGTPDFLGNVTFSGAAIFGAGGTLSGTFGGNPTLTGTWTGGTQTGADVSGNDVTATNGTTSRSLARRAAGCDAAGSNCQTFDAKDSGWGAGNSGADNRTALAAIAAQCAAVSATGAGMLIKLPAGTYSYDSSGGEISLACNGVTVEGDGNQGTVILYTGTNNWLHVSAPAGQAFNHGFTLRNVRLFQATTNATAGTAVILESTTQATLADVQIDGFFQGVECKSCIHTTGVNVQLTGDNTASGAQQMLVHKVSVGGGNAAGNKFIGLEVGGSSISYTCGIRVADSDGLELVGSHVFRATTALCIQPEYANDVLYNLDLDGTTLDQAGQDYVSQPISGWTSDSFTQLTNADTPSGTTLPFASTTNLLVGMTVSGTNIPANDILVSKTSNSITLQTAITGDVANGATITFTVKNYATSWRMNGGSMQNATGDACAISDSHVNGVSFNTLFLNSGGRGCYVSAGANVSFNGSAFLNSNTANGGVPHLQFGGTVSGGSAVGATFGSGLAAFATHPVPNNITLSDSADYITLGPNTYSGATGAQDIVLTSSGTHNSISSVNTTDKTNFSWAPLIPNTLGAPTALQVTAYDSTPLLSIGTTGSGTGLQYWNIQSRTSGAGGPRMFPQDNASSANINGTISALGTGKLTLGITTNSQVAAVAPLLVGADATAITPLVGAVGSVANAHFSSVGDQRSRVTYQMWVTTSAALAVRLTTNGSGTATTTNCGNLALDNSKATLDNIRLTATDVTTPANDYSYFVPVGFLQRYTGVASTTYTNGTPIENGTGTGTGAGAPTTSITADTTNACPNISWTPPTGNTNTWHVLVSYDMDVVQ